MKPEVIALTQLERDIAPFCEINDRAMSNGAVSASDQEALMRLAPPIIAKHLDFFAAFFVTSLSELDSSLRLSSDDGTCEYAFDGAGDAANSFEESVIQVQDKIIASSVSILIILTFLSKSNRNVEITTEVAEAGIRTIARLAYKIKTERGVGDMPSISPFSDADRTMLHRLAAALGSRARKEGFAEFVNFAPEAESCGVGVLLKDQKIVLATFVGTRSPEGCKYSVRNFQNEVVPGIPQMFPGIAQAISAHEMYFACMVDIVRKKAAPWWLRSFV